MKYPRTKRGYPKNFLIKGEEWRVVFVDAIVGKDTLGMCDPESRIIYIKNKQTPEETFKTFIHECIHMLEMEYDIKISHKSVHKFELAIFEFLRDNF